MKFEIHQKLPSLNEVINVNRSNYYQGNSLKKQIQKDICQWIQLSLLKGEIKPVSQCIVDIKWHEKTRKRDADNIQSSTKFILDAMVDMGIIKDDSRRYVPQVYHEIIDDDEDFVEVFLHDGV